jgi:hypothetical protein
MILGFFPDQDLFATPALHGFAHFGPFFQLDSATPPLVKRRAF